MWENTHTHSTLHALCLSLNFLVYLFFLFVCDDDNVQIERVAIAFASVKDNREVNVLATAPPGQTYVLVSLFLSMVYLITADGKIIKRVHSFFERSKDFCLLFKQSQLKPCLSFSFFDWLITIANLSNDWTKTSCKFSFICSLSFSYAAAHCWYLSS